MTPPRGVEDAAPYKDGPKPPHTRSPFHHPVGAGHARPATSRRLPSIFHRSPIPPNHLTPQPACRPPPPYFVPTNCHHPNIHLAQTSPSNFVEKIKKTCKNLLTKVILLAIIIKLSREPSPRRQPLEPLPTACTPFFEENFFKKTFRKPLDKRENLIYNIQAVTETRQRSRTLKIEQN